MQGDLSARGAFIACGGLTCPSLRSFFVNRFHPSAVDSVETVCVDASGASGPQIKKESGSKVLPQKSA